MRRISIQRKSIPGPGCQRFCPDTMGYASRAIDPANATIIRLLGSNFFADVAGVDSSISWWGGASRGY